MKRNIILFLFLLMVTTVNILARERVLINEGWSFFRYESAEQADSLIYDIRPEITDRRDDKPADAKPTEAVRVEAMHTVLKPWILPSGNAFVSDPAKHHVRPKAEPPFSDFPFLQADFDDSAWERVRLPHDWAIKGPFYAGWDAEVGGGMGRLPSHGVAWYRKQLIFDASDRDKQIYLDVDGAMSYAMVWLNGTLVGGWPYGYASWRLDLTPYIHYGEINQLAIRLDNPNHSARWYPGGGLYRNVWLCKTHPIHVDHWGTFVRTPQVSAEKARIEWDVVLKNSDKKTSRVDVLNAVYELTESGQRSKRVAQLESQSILLPTKDTIRMRQSVDLKHPKRWGPYPSQKQHRYVLVTTIRSRGKVLDQYETRFGIRALRFDGQEGLFVNDERIFVKGVNQHHDLGALGAAFNVRAAQRQLERLRALGCNAIRMAHNPPDPQLLELTDQMGFLVVDEVFDSWERKKTPHDFHLIFPEWHEQDLRSMIRRDRNHPSVILWSIGNEVGEQYTGDEGAAIGHRLAAISKSEDPTRLVTASMNYAKPDMPFPGFVDVINLNYQGEGIRDTPAHAHLNGIRTNPLYPAFHEKFPDKLILSSENAAALSTRGTYLFPVHEGISSPVTDQTGGDSKNGFVSAYELYAVDFGSSPDKVFATKDKHPYVGGGFVWSGWDYLGEPSPYYSSRSSYFGIIDLAGFKKDRFYLYQARWRPDHPMIHILPHWNWPDRVGQITPIHVFTSGDEVELFLNGTSLGRKIKKPYEYRLRWDEVVYEPGCVKAVAYKNGRIWASAEMETTGKPARVVLEADRTEIAADGVDLSFVTAKVVDENGLLVPNASALLSFRIIQGEGEIVATDNGNPADLTAFPSKERSVLSGQCLAILRSVSRKKSFCVLEVSSKGLESGTIRLNFR